MKLFKGKDEDFNIEEATGKDVGICAEMINKMMGGTPVNREVLEQSLKNPNVILFVAKENGKIIGMISGLAFPSMIPPPRIDFLTASKEGNILRTVISSLIDKFVKELKRRLPKAKYVDTYVPTANPQFVAIYSSKGFEIAGFIRGDPPLSDVVILKKYLYIETPAGYTV